MLRVPIIYRRGFIVLGLASAVACSPGGGEKSSATSSAPASPQAPDPAPAGFSPGSQPVPISGINLVDANNADVHCDYQPTPTAQTYAAQCLIVVQQSSGQQVAAAAIKAGTTVAWQAPQAASGSMNFSGCAPAANKLSYACQVAVTDVRSLAQAQFSLQIQDATDTSRTIADTLLLPYAVNVAAGFVPSMPYQYIARSTSPTVAAADLAVVGVQHQSFPFDQTGFDSIHGICRRGPQLFFADAWAIYSVQGGVVTHYAGSRNSRNATNFSDKLRTFLRPHDLFCTATNLYVGSYDLNRIYKLADDGTIEVIAGNGGTSEPGEGVAAVTASLPSVTGIAVDSQNNIFFGDSTSSRLRMVSAAGVLTTVAGNGNSGYSGDGGPANAATLASVNGPVVSSDGSVYFADENNNVVRKVSPAGVITTVAGTGAGRYLQTTDPRALADPTQVMLDSAGNVYIAERYRGIKKLLAGGTYSQVVSVGTDLPAFAFNLSQNVFAAYGSLQPSADSYILTRPVFDYTAIGADGSFYTDGPEGIVGFSAAQNYAAAPVAGVVAAMPPDCTAPVSAATMPLFEATAIAFAPDHSIIALDYRNLTDNQLVVHHLAPTNGGGFTAQALNGCAADPLLTAFNPMAAPYNVSNHDIGSLAAIGDGTFLLANRTQNTVVKIAANGTASPFAGTGTFGTAVDGSLASANPLSTPLSLAIGVDKSVYVLEAADTSNPGVGSRIRRITPAGLLTTVAGGASIGDQGDQQAATSARIAATGIALDSSGRIYIADAGNAKIKMIDASGIIHTIAGGGTQLGSSVPVAALQAALSYPTTVQVANDGTVYFVNDNTDQVMQLKPAVNAAAGTTPLYDLAVLFGTQINSSCGTTTAPGSATQNNVASGILSSLAKICEAAPRTIAIQDSCPSAQGATRLLLTQTAGARANLIEIVKPCGT